MDREEIYHIFCSLRSSLPRKDPLTEPDMLDLYRNDLEELDANPRNVRRYTYEQRFFQLLRMVPKPSTGSSTSLDIGCAQGNYTSALSLLGYRSIGVDINRSFVTYAKMKAKKCGCQQRTEFLVADAYHLPFRDESFKTILLGEIIEHLSQPLKVVEKLRALLDEEGYAVVSTPNGGRLTLHSKRTSTGSEKRYECDPLHHIIEYTTQEVSILLHRCGFLVSNSTYTTSIFWLIPGLLKIPLSLSTLTRMDRLLLGIPLLGRLFGLGIVTQAQPTRHLPKRR